MRLCVCVGPSLSLFLSFSLSLSVFVCLCAFSGARVRASVRAHECPPHQRSPLVLPRGPSRKFVKVAESRVTQGIDCVVDSDNGSSGSGSVTVDALYANGSTASEGEQGDEGGWGGLLREAGAGGSPNGSCYSPQLREGMTLQG